MMKNEKTNEDMTDMITDIITNNVLHQYTPSQMDEVMNFIEEKFGGGGKRTGEGWLVHETKSEYVHTDVVITGNEDYQHIVTCGMGVRQMNNWMIMMDEELKRLEILFVLSPEFKLTEKDRMILSGELTRITKYPFANNTFFGPGHTINASKEFKERFGYDYFLFYVPVEKINVYGVGDVHFIPLIPIYEEEREWMVNNNSIEWLYESSEAIDEIVLIDKQREKFIPTK